MPRPLRLLYLCGDPVNRVVLAARLPAGATQTDDPAAADLTLADLDHLPFATSLAALLAAPSDAVHGYNLTAGQAAALRRRGVRVARRITRRSVRRLLARAKVRPAGA